MPCRRSRPRRPLAGALVALALAALAPSVAHAQAAGSVRAAVAEAAQRAQSAVAAKQPAQALEAIAAARRLPDLGVAEIALLERLALAAALDAKQWPVAAGSLRWLLEHAPLADAEQLPLGETMVELAWRTGDVAEVVRWAGAWRARGGDGLRVHRIVLQALTDAGRRDDALAEIARQRRADAAAGRTPDEAALRQQAQTQERLEDARGLAETMTTLVRHHPRPEYWANLLAGVLQSPRVPQRHRIDVYRLMQATGTLDDPDDILEAARLAMLAGLPDEALERLAAGRRDGRLASEAHRQVAARIEQEARARAQEDERSGAGTARTNEPDDLAQAADVQFARAQWAQAAALYQRAMQGAGPRRAAEVRLHAAIALAHAQQPAPARELLSSLQGDAALGTVAALWSLQLR